MCLRMQLLWLVTMVEVRTGTLPMPDLLLRELFIKFLIGTNKELW